MEEINISIQTEVIQGDRRIHLKELLATPAVRVSVDIEDIKQQRRFKVNVVILKNKRTTRKE